MFRRQRNTREQLRLLRESEWPEELDIRKVPPLEWQERWNILLVAVMGQGFQVLAVSISLGLFFLIFGLLVVDDATLTAWEWKRRTDGAHGPSST